MILKWLDTVETCNLANRVDTLICSIIRSSKWREREHGGLIQSHTGSVTVRLHLGTLHNVACQLPAVRQRESLGFQSGSVGLQCTAQRGERWLLGIPYEVGNIDEH